MSIEQPMDMNEPRPEPAKQEGQDYQPSEEEEKTIKFVRGLLSKGKTNREPYIEKWKDYYHDFRGKQWRTKRPSYRHSSVINLIFTAIQNQVPLMTDARPTVEYIATEPNDVPLAELLNDVFQSDWERYDWNYPLLECLYDSHIYGTALANIGFDPSADFGLGAVTWRSLEPIYGYPEPGASDVNTQRKCGWFVYAEPQNLDKIRATWPEKGRFVKSDMQDLWEATKTDLNDIRFQSPADNRAVIEGKPSQNRGNQEQALVITLWCRPLDTEENEVTRTKDDGSEETVYETKLKYPNGRKIVLAGNVILEEGDLEADDKSIPVQRLVNYVDPRSFYGISDIEQQEGPQQTFNKLVSFSLDVLTLMGNPIWVVDTESGVDTDNLFNIPGAVIEKEPGSEVRREAGTQLQPYVMQLIDRMKLWFDDVSGSQEVTRGSNPSGVTAARAIEALQETGRTRIRQKTRNMDNFLREFGRQYAQWSLQNYTVPRIRRITGKDGSDKYFKFSTERVNSERGTRTVVQATELQKDDKTGKFIEGKKLDQVLMGEFDVRVSTVSGLPFAKAEREQKLFRLRELDIIDDEELLKGIEYPNADSVLQRMNERREQQALLAQQQQQQGAQ
jgi:hypothetical protein